MIALSRTLNTQGLLLRLPYNVTVGDTFAVPSLAAALLLGLREHIGGHPDHLAVAEVIEPVLSDGSDNHDAILLHDVVPGGTGYLAELADPERLRELLVVAWQTVKDCPCRDEPRLACHRCLLPFALPGQVAHVSRAAAERHLRALLGLAEDATSAEDTSWSVSEVPPDRGTQLDSALEQRVYELLVQRLGAKGLGLTVKETPGPHGNTARFVGAGREWTLVPQVVVAGSKPDFVLSCADANVPDTAIFIDGHRYHATVAHNRLADDARKRGALRDRGWQVIALTAADVEAAVTGDDAAQPFWYSSEITAAVIQSTQTSASPQAYRRLATGAVDQLVAWVQDSQPSDREHVARAVPLFLVSGGSPVAAPGDVPLARLAADALDGLNSASASPVSSARNVVVHRWGALSVAVESLGGGMTAVALVLDDRDGAIDAAHADAWRRWLQLSNALALRDWPTTISTVSAIVAEAPSAEPAGVAAPAGSTDVRDVPAEWRPVIDLARDGRERALVLELARRDGLVPPTVGLEGPDGIPLDLAWPREMVAVEVDALANEDRTYLLAHGWRVLGPDDPDAVALALADLTHPPAPLAPEADA